VWKKAISYSETAVILKTITVFGIYFNYSSYFKVVSEILQL